MQTKTLGLLHGVRVDSRARTGTTQNKPATSCTGQGGAQGMMEICQKDRGTCREELLLAKSGITGATE